jgi:hypothetical protein
MNLSEYFSKVDTSVMNDCRALVSEIFSFTCVLIVVPLEILVLLCRIMFPWLMPFITKEEV